MQLLVLQIQAINRMGRLLESAGPEKKQEARPRPDRTEEKQTRTPSEGREKR